MQGKTWLSDRALALLDEIPSAYKDVEQVMEDQKDLVEVEHTLWQVSNYTRERSGSPRSGYSEPATNGPPRSDLLALQVR
jgi:hypothetical protein